LENAFLQALQKNSYWGMAAPPRWILPAKQVAV